MTPYVYIPSPVKWNMMFPEHWKFIRGKYLFIKESRPVQSTDDVVTCFRDGTVTLRKNRRTKGFTESLKEIGYQGIRKGDLVIHVMDAFAGAIGVSDSDGKGTPVYSVCTPIMDLNNYYYAYLLRDIARKGFIQSLYKGIRERSSDFRFDVFANQIYPVPPREEQDQIVRFLDWKVSEINKLIAIKRRMISQYLQLRKAIIDKGILHGIKQVEQKNSGVYWLGMIPKTWDVVPLKRICIFNASVSNQAGKMSNSDMVTFLPMENVTVTGEVDCTLKKPLQEVISGYSSFAKGDVVIAKITPCFENGKGACLDCLDTEIGYGTTEFINLRPNDRILSRFLYMITMTRPFRMLGEQVMTGSAGQKRIPSSFVKNFTVGIPTIEEQKEILEEIDSRLSAIDDIINIEKQEIYGLQELKNTLICDVVTGKIDVRGIEIPEYEFIAEEADSDSEAEEMEEGADEE